MADLTVTISESLSLNGKEQGAKNTQTVTSVTQFDHRVVTATTTEQSILLFDSAVAAGTFEDSSVEYMRVTNLNDTNFVEIRVLGSSEEYFVKLEPRGSFILGNSVMDANATGSQSLTFGNIESILAKADTANCQLEIFVAV